MQDWLICHRTCSPEVAGIFLWRDMVDWCWLSFLQLRLFWSKLKQLWFKAESQIKSHCSGLVRTPKGCSLPRSMVAEACNTAVIIPKPKPTTNKMPANKVICGIQSLHPLFIETHAWLTEFQIICQIIVKKFLTQTCAYPNARRVTDTECPKYFHLLPPCRNCSHQLNCVIFLQ